MVLERREKTDKREEKRKEEEEEEEEKEEKRKEEIRKGKKKNTGMELGIFVWNLLSFVGKSIDFRTLYENYGCMELGIFVWNYKYLYRKVWNYDFV